MIKHYRLLFQLTLLYCIVAAVWLVPWAAKNQANAKAQQAAAQVTTQFSSDIPLYLEGTPTRIIIPSLGLDHFILPGEATANTWAVSPNQPHFALVSSLANNNQGTTIVYGHNTESVFGKLSELQVGDQVTLITNEGHVFIYEYKKYSIIAPTDTSIFVTKSSPQLGLLTCDGFFNDKRKLYYFSLVEAK